MFVSCVLIFPRRPETWETSVGKLLFRLLAVCFSLEMRRGFYEARHLKLEIGTRRGKIRLDPSPFRPYRAFAFVIRDKQSTPRRNDHQQSCYYFSGCRLNTKITKQTNKTSYWLNYWLFVNIFYANPQKILLNINSNNVRYILRLVTVSSGSLSAFHFINNNVRKKIVSDDIVTAMKTRKKSWPWQHRNFNSETLPPKFHTQLIIVKAGNFKVCYCLEINCTA